MKPDQVNKLLQGLALPFSLKAGMIGKLEFKVNILKMFGASQSTDIAIEELNLIFSPNVSMQSNDEVSSFTQSFSEDEHPSVPYDEYNMYNIFEHQLKVRKKGRIITLDRNMKFAENGETKKEDLSSEKSMIEFLKNLNLKVKKVHIRYEDDTFS